MQPTAAAQQRCFLMGTPQVREIRPLRGTLGQNEGSYEIRVDIYNIYNSEAVIVIDRKRMICPIHWSPMVSKKKFIDCLRYTPEKSFTISVELSEIKAASRVHIECESSGEESFFINYLLNTQDPNDQKWLATMQKWVNESGIKAERKEYLNKFATERCWQEKIQVNAAAILSLPEIEVARKNLNVCQEVLLQAKESLDKVRDEANECLMFTKRPITKDLAERFHQAMENMKEQLILCIDADKWSDCWDFYRTKFDLQKIVNEKAV